MNDNLITEIIDLNKVKANLLELQKMWEQLITTMAAKSGKDLKFDNLAQNLKTITISETELAKVKQAGLEVDGKKVKITAEIIANYDKYSKEEQKIIENEIKRKAQVSETNKLLKDKFTNEQDLVKVLQRETKSIADLDKQNKDLQRIQQKLNLTTKEGLDANAKINAQIEKNKETTKEYTNVIDEQRRNIGNYASATENLTASIDATTRSAQLSREEMEKMASDFGQLLGGIGAVTASIVLLGDEGSESMKELQEKMNKAVGIMMGLKGAAEMGVGAMKLWIPVQKALNAAVASNPVGVYAAAITALSAAVTTLIVKLNDQSKLQKEIANSLKDATVQIKQEQRAMNDLFEELKNTNIGSKERVSLIDQLNTEYSEYLPKLLDEKTSLDDISIAQNAANDALARKILLAAKETAITDALNSAYGDQVDAVNKIKEKMDDWGVSTTTQSILITEFTKLVNEGSSVIGAFRIASERAGLGSMSLPSSGLERPVLRLYDSLIEAKDVMNEVSSSYDVLLNSFGEPVGRTGGGGSSTSVGGSSTSVDGLTPLEILQREYYWSIKLANQIEDRETRQRALIRDTLAYQTGILDMYKQLFIANGEFTAREQADFEFWTEQVAETQSQLDKLNYEIANAPKLINKSDVKTVESVAKATGEISMNMRNIAPAANDAAAQFTKLEQITAKLRNAFNDFFGTKQIEDWRDAFKESITTVFNESFELYNQIIYLQNEKFDQELDNLNKLYDKQVSGLESAYDRRKKLLEATIDDEEQLAAELARIEEEKADVQAKFQDEKFAKEQEIAKKQAILAKKQAEMEVAAGSASALVEAIKLIGIATTTAAPGDPYSLVARIAAALAAALTVVGAVTAGIARVKAIEIPQFWAGGEAQEGQLISVAERGEELAVGKSGKSYMFDKHSVLVAPEKMRIFSNKETKQIMEKQTINNTYEKQSNVNLTVNIDNERHKKYFKLN